MMKRSCLIFSLFLVQLTSPVLSQTVLNISTSHAEGRTGNIPKLTIWPGSGLSLNFISTGEHIVRVWLDDPSKLTVDFDKPISNSPNSATVIHLRLIKPLAFANLPLSSNTLLTVVTESGKAKKVYYFLVYYGSGQAKYVAVNVNTDSRYIRPQPQPQRLEISNKGKTERIEKGLKIAKEQNTDKQNEVVFERVELLLVQVHLGMSLSEAMRRFNLSPSVLEKLETLAISSGELR